jgi:hypothetical protein
MESVETLGEVVLRGHAESRTASATVGMRPSDV